MGHAHTVIDWSALLIGSFSYLWLFQVKKAFFALVANGVRAAPLWESKKQSFVGKTHNKSEQAFKRNASSSK